MNIKELITALAERGNNAKKRAERYRDNNPVVYANLSGRADGLLAAMQLASECANGTDLANEMRREVIEAPPIKERPMA